MEPVTFTAATIASLAFATFLETATERYSEAALNKIDELRKKLWERLRGNPKAEKAMQSLESGEKSELSRLSTYLQDAMEDDGEFAELVAALAKEIKDGEKEDSGSMTQVNRDNAKGWQTKVEGGTAYVGEIHFHNNSDG